MEGSSTENTEEDVLKSLDVCTDCEKSEKEKASARRRVIFYILRKKIFRNKEVPKSAPDGSPLDLSDPTRFGLFTTRHHHFFIPSGDGQIGAWYLQPQNEASSGKIILYSHGVSNTRGGVNRIGLYNVFLENGFSVLTYDYRGFGDSSVAEIVEDSVVEDCTNALAWLREKEGEHAKILVWGHSMGTGITCHAMANVFNEMGEDTGVAGVVLEAPYNNFADELFEIGKSVKNAFVKKALETIYKSTGDKPIEKLVQELNIAFESHQWIQHIRCPVMILHAEDDHLIPVSQGVKLFEGAKAGGKHDVELEQFEASLQCGHSSIYKAKQLPTLIDQFYSKL